MRTISPGNLVLKPMDLWKDQWLLLTSGTMDDCNMMTVAWGSIGCMWNRPFVQVVVRPQRHTLKYIENSSCFTLCGFPPEYRDALKHLGTVSGKDRDKLSETRLTLRPSERCFLRPTTRLPSSWSAGRYTASPWTPPAS